MIILRDVATALDHAHSKNVSHNDIKPDNVLVSKNCRVSGRVFDWEHSGEISNEEDSSINTAIYDENYYWGKSPLDGEKDIFSLAVTIFECISKINLDKDSGIRIIGDTRKRMCKLLGIIEDTEITSDNEREKTVLQQLKILILKMVQPARKERPSAETIVAELDKFIQMLNS